MGKVIEFPMNEERSTVLREQGFAAVASANYGVAVKKFEEYLTAVAREKEPPDSQALIQLGQSYLELGQNEESVILSSEFAAVLLADAAGVEFIYRVGVAAPHFMLIKLAVEAARGEHQKQLTARAAAFNEEFLATHEVAVANNVRRLSHIGGLNLFEQERFVQEVLPTIPLTQANEGLRRALNDPDLLPFIRATFVSWLQQQHLNEAFDVYVFDQTYSFNPAKITSPYTDPTIMDIVQKAVHQKNLGEDATELTFIYMSLLYPVADQVIPNIDVFVSQLVNPEIETEYADLKRWLDQQFNFMSSLVNK